MSIEQSVDARLLVTFYIGAYGCTVNDQKLKFTTSRLTRAV